MATNTSALKTFAQQTRLKLLSLIKTKLEFILTQDTAELRGYETQIANLKTQIQSKGKDIVVEQVAYTWFNRVMALRFMDANGYTTPMAVTPAAGQMRPEILQEAMGGSVDDDLRITPEDLLLPEAKLYKRLLVASCNYWGGSMPFLFEHILDYTELLLPDDLLSEQSFVSDIRRAMTDEDCQNVEIMGWLYQFYITDRKADAETKKSKKGGLKSDEQAAATQLFTPHWVVRYMVENSLGRIWMTLHPESRLIDDMPYYIQTPEGQTDTIPEDIHSVQDIRFIDPCMGSGHVLVYAFDLFCKMYEEEGYQSSEIPALILQNNIFGLDIDRRCYQLTSFALTMKGRAYYSRYLRKVVEPNVIALQPIDHDTIDASGSWGQKSLMWQFENIDTIGSLLKVTPEECAAIHVDSGLFGVNQKILKTQAEYLSRKYHCVVTNPPYLGKGFCDDLKNYVVSQFPNSKADLYAAFIEHLTSMPCKDGYTAMVTMESWMFLPSYEKLRIYLIDNITIKSLSHFDLHIMRIAYGTVSFILQNKKSQNIKGIYSYLSRKDVDLQNEIPYVFPNKDNGRYSHAFQSKFKNIPGSPIAYWASDHILRLFENEILYDVSDPRLGMATADNNKFLRCFWEVSSKSVNDSCSSTEESSISMKRWYPYAKGGEFRKWYGNTEFVVNWYNNGYEIQHFTDEKGKVRSHNYNLDFIFKKGITWNALSSGDTAFRTMNNSLFDNAGSSLFTKEDTSYFNLLGYLNTKLVKSLFPVLNPTYNYQPGTIGSLPYLCAPIENYVSDNVSISRHDWDSHETSWNFKTNELYRLALGLTFDQVQSSSMAKGGLNSSLEDVVNDYTQFWQEKFTRLHANEEDINRQFIEIYGLKEELTPDVPLEDITILQKGEILIDNGQLVWHKDVIIKQFVSWMVGCFMGRYSADKPGLIIASQGQKIVDLDLPAMTLEIDDDGIIPIIQEADFFSDDMTQRIESGVKTLFGEQYFYDNMKYIKACLGQELREYLYKEFYDDHMQMYSVKINGANAKRPIYWLFSSKMGDKRKKGYFKALVYMHRMESDTLSKLHADYVVPYISKIEQQHIEAEDLSLRDDLSQAQRNRARKSAEEYADQIRELKEFEQVLVQMASQRLSIDLDDGVRVNYPKFYPLVEPIKGLDKE